MQTPNRLSGKAQGQGQGLRRPSLPANFSSSSASSGSHTNGFPSSPVTSTSPSPMESLRSSGSSPTKRNSLPRHSSPLAQPPPAGARRPAFGAGGGGSFPRRASSMSSTVPLIVNTPPPPQRPTASHSNEGEPPNTPSPSHHSSSSVVLDQDDAPSPTLSARTFTPSSRAARPSGPSPSSSLSTNGSPPIILESSYVSSYTPSSTSSRLLDSDSSLRFAVGAPPPPAAASSSHVASGQTEISSYWEGTQPEDVEIDEEVTRQSDSNSG